MPRLTNSDELDEEIEINSAADLLPLNWNADLADYVLDLRWSADGSHLAALPSTGGLQLFDLIRACPRISDFLARAQPHVHSNS